MSQQSYKGTLNPASYFLHCSSIGRMQEAVSHFLIPVPTTNLHLRTPQQVLAAAMAIGIVILVKETEKIVWDFVTKFPKTEGKLSNLCLYFGFR
jgi:hypothetical protein